MSAVYIAVGLGVAVLVWMAFSYNALVLARNQANESWSGVDVQLKRRHDLVPNLVGAVRAHAQHETDMMWTLSEARDGAMASSGRRGRQGSEQELSEAIAAVRIASERYPELRADDSFRRLQAQIAEVEGEIQYARRIYNSNVQRFNARVRSFPGALVGRMFGLRAMGYFDLSPIVQGASAADRSDYPAHSSAAAA